MRLTESQLAEYRKNGLLVQEGVFSEQEIDLLTEETEREYKKDTPRRILEESGGAVRGVHGCHLYSDVFARLVRDPRMLLPMRQLLGEDLYVHQFKINAKRSFVGDVWKWHQDFPFWHFEDRMPAPNAASVAVFLDDVTEFNGPLFFVPGAHRTGLIEVPAQGSGWNRDLVADFKYSLDQETVQTLVESNGMFSAKGKKGGVVWFDCTIPHASSPNISPFNRSLLIVSYCRTDNVPTTPGTPRPEWLAGNDYTPLRPLEESTFA
ncbi:phytanoyl-CoA dioxygenase family protein [Streptomyces scopuliridis]|uniref:phytanoyl-CoA dioxygenase family protein n=1 Tax=Streptomyces scopuliridis TaxID=452529 RepID=UPI00369E086B